MSKIKFFIHWSTVLNDSWNMLWIKKYLKKGKLHFGTPGMYIRVGWNFKIFIVQSVTDRNGYTRHVYKKNKN